MSGRSAAGDLPPVMSPEEQRQRAQQLLNDPLLLQALHEIVADAMQTWRDTENPAQREQQWHTVQAITLLQMKLEKKLADPKIIERRDRLLRRTG